LNASAVKEELKFFLFIFPWLFGFCFLFIVPAGQALYYSFTDYNAIAAPNWVGLDNYQALLKNRIFWKSLENTLFFVFIGVPVNLVFQIAVALLLHRPLKGIALFRTLYYLPYLVPVLAIVILWRILFTDFGIVNHLLEAVGIGKIPWFSERWIKPLLVLMAMWASGSSVIVFLAALNGVPKYLYEAAKIDGARPISMFFRITLPMITPAILFSVIIQMINTFQIFTEPWVLNRGGPNYASYTYALNVYMTAFRENDFGLAMAQSWLLVVVILIVTLLLLRSSRSWVYYEGEK